jgi:hypothetical protein
MDIVAASNRPDRFATVAPLDRLMLLARGELGLSAETLAVRLGAGPAFAGADANKLPLELCQSAQNGEHQATVRRVVSAHASPKDRKPAFRSVIAASLFNKSRVDRASRSSRVTITTSPAATSESNRRSCGLSVLARSPHRETSCPPHVFPQRRHLSGDALAVG